MKGIKNYLGDNFIPLHLLTYHFVIGAYGNIAYSDTICTGLEESIQEIIDEQIGKYQEKLKKSEGSSIYLNQSISNHAKERLSFLLDAREGLVEKFYSAVQSLTDSGDPDVTLVVTDLVSGKIIALQLFTSESEKSWSGLTSAVIHTLIEDWGKTQENETVQTPEYWRGLL